jgi:hypothetical protein
MNIRSVDNKKLFVGNLTIEVSSCLSPILSAKVIELSQLNSREISQLENKLSIEKEKFYELGETLTTCEKIFGGTYVQELVQKEIERKQAEFISNDVKRKI